MSPMFSMTKAKSDFFESFVSSSITNKRLAKSETSS